MTKPRTAPRQQRSRATYERILDVAAEVFAQRGYAGTTTNKVAEAAGISIGTLYNYVTDKDALLYAVAERHLDSGTDDLIETFGKLRESRPGLEESLRVMVKVVVRLHVDEFHLHHLLYDSAPRSDELQVRLHEADIAVSSEVAWHLERLGLANEHRALIADLLVFGVEAQVHRAIIDARLLGDAPADPDVLIDVLTQLWTRALADS
jgi:AcrR family transcriptional regulator